LKEGFALHCSDYSQLVDSKAALSERRELNREMSEWFKEHAWKACVGETLPWVRIPLSPPKFHSRSFWRSELSSRWLRLSPQLHRIPLSPPKFHSRSFCGSELSSRWLRLSPQLHRIHSLRIPLFAKFLTNSTISPRAPVSNLR